MEGSAAAAGDDRTFRVNFSSEGVALLQERVKEKLKEFMGDYTDDTLVEYIVVLLRNGRRKDEARKELDVFLGDDSAAFVSWLWDHLSSSMHQYVLRQESDGLGKANSNLNELPARLKSEQDSLTSNVPTERENSSKVPRGHQSRNWKGSVQEGTEIFPLQSVITDVSHQEEEKHHRPNRTGQLGSPKPRVYRKQSCDDERQSTKRDSASHPVIDAPRRLLQFAVRDAVKTVQQFNSRSEPVLKRLRSVVSMSTRDSQEKRSKRVRSGSRLPVALSTALKAAAEAAEDVNRVRSSGSVFDRLSHGRQTVEPISRLSDTRAAELEDMEYEDFNQFPPPSHGDSHLRDKYDEEFVGNMIMLDKETGMAVDSDSDNIGYDSVDIVRHRGLDASQSASSAKDSKSVMVGYSVAEEPDEISRKRNLMDLDPTASSAAMTSSKIVNISVNVNTWKPPSFQVPRDVSTVETQLAVDNADVSVAKSNARLPKENDASANQNLKEMEHMNVKKEPQRTAAVPGSYTTGHPSEDVDSRTLFVSNVHFAATKDTLSRHFNKFGDVLKVLIVTDASTGQPTGSAYVEFLKKEAADLALSLNGTSFMSRILKVVRRSSHEASPVLGWSRVARAPFTTRLGRMPHPRGLFPGTFRARLAVKPGARSLQWKREGSTAQSSDGTKGPLNSPVTPGSNVLSPTARSLTYMRTESKADGTPAPT